MMSRKPHKRQASPPAGRQYRRPQDVSKKSENASPPPPKLTQSVVRADHTYVAKPALLWWHRQKKKSSAHQKGHKRACIRDESCSSETSDNDFSFGMNEGKGNRSSDSNSFHELGNLDDGFSSTSICLSIDVAKRKNAFQCLVILVLAKAGIIGLYVWLGGTANPSGSNFLLFGQEKTIERLPPLNFKEPITEEEISLTKPSFETLPSIPHTKIGQNTYEIHNLWNHFGQQQNLESATATSTTPKTRKERHHHFRQVFKRLIAKFFHESKSRSCTGFGAIKKNQSVGKLNPDIVLTTSTKYERSLIQELGKRVRQRAQQKEYKNDLYTDFNSRLAAIPWGGIALFKRTTPATRMWWATSDNDSTDGHEILFNYLDTMKWPEDLHTKSSLTSKSLCSHQSKGCPVELVLLHTIEFREKYKPWLLTPSMVEQSKTGWIYQHGNSKDGSSIVWYRPGLLHKVISPDLFIRTIIFTLEYAVVESFIRSAGSFGRYNVVVDCKNFSFSSVPSFGKIRRLVTILQDHFPHRTSFIFLANLAPTAQVFLKMIRPLLSEKVNQKIHIIPTNAEERRLVLQEFIDQDKTPTWLGGDDTFTFDPKSYYSWYELANDNESLEYLTSMPHL